MFEAKYWSSNTFRLGLWTVLTVGLYSGFFLFIDRIFGLLTSGTMLGGVGVVATALLFSFVHGSFASHLLDAVGLRALEKQGD